MKIRLSKAEKSSLKWILDEFIKTHEAKIDIYRADIEIAKKILTELTNQSQQQIKRPHITQGCTDCMPSENDGSNKSLSGENQINSPADTRKGCEKEFDINDSLDVDSIKVCGKDGLCDNCKEKNLKDLFTCPKCNSIFEEVNGLFVNCKCGYMEDSNFNQITNWDSFKQKGEKI